MMAAWTIALGPGLQAKSKTAGARAGSRHGAAGNRAKGTFRGASRRVAAGVRHAHRPAHSRTARLVEAGAALAGHPSGSACHVVGALLALIGHIAASVDAGLRVALVHVLGGAGLRVDGHVGHGIRDAGVGATLGSG